MNQPDKIGIMVCGHGSRNQNAAREFSTVAEGLRDVMPDVPVEYGYLEFCNPVISVGLDRLREQGVTRVLAVPGMLFAAGHAKNDIPSVLNTYAAQHGVRIDYGRELGIDPKMMRAAADRIQAAVDEANAEHGQVAKEDTLLMVVGRGSSDPDANSNISKVMRLLWEGFGFGWGEVCYSGVTFPLVEPGLEHAARLGYKRVIVAPYFLFTGVLIKRIYKYTDDVAERFPDIQFCKAGYLGNHDQVIATFRERAMEIIEGQTAMNCAMCKYRAQVLGFEDQVGLPQESHHHHVEGIGGGLENCPCKGDCDASCRNPDFCAEHDLPFTPVHSHAAPNPLDGEYDHSHGHSHDHSGGHSHDHGHLHGHGHGHAHDHGHTHHPYPHADHPHGPRSMEKS
ncbi:MAG: sirohydrochlorin chelatase [Pseudomonadota bacterium]